MLNDFTPMNILGIALAGALLVHSGSANAQRTYADEANLLDAQINLLQKREQLNAARSRQVEPGLTSLPQVVAVMGLDGNLQARLLLSSGAVHTYGEGDQISPSMKVSVITGREVIVAVNRPGRKGKPLLAPLHFMAGTTQPTGGIPGIPGVPGMPVTHGLGSPAPMPEGMLPALPAVNFGAMPAPMQPAHRSPAQTSPQTAAPSQPVAANAPGPVAAPAVSSRPDQDLIESR